MDLSTIIVVVFIAYCVVLLLSPFVRLFTNRKEKDNVD